MKVITPCVIPEVAPNDACYTPPAPNVRKCSYVAFKVIEEGQIFTEAGALA